MAKNRGSSPRINVDELAAEMNRLMSEYLDATYSNVEASCREVASVVVQDLQETSPMRTGQYARNWRSAYETGNLAFKEIIYNHQYQLPHLLEYGHAKVTGGRKQYGDMTRAFPHVEPEQKMADELFMRLLKRRIEGGK